jgi:thymidylate synthase (FAD)
MKEAGELYSAILGSAPDRFRAAGYALTNAHRRRVIFSASGRELTHLSRLRLDSNAQWDIRRLAGRMISLAREACPGLMQFAGGKDQFAELREEPGAAGNRA